jgi:hypothetical protein
MTLEFRVRVSTVLLGVGAIVWGIASLNPSGFPDLRARLQFFGAFLLVCALASAFATILALAVQRQWRAIPQYAIEMAVTLPLVALALR